MGYKVVFTSRAARQLEKIDRPHQRLIARWIDENLDGCDNPRTASGVTQLTGLANAWRARVGRYRILFEIRDAEVLVTIVRVASRDKAYRSMDDIFTP